jgi:gliding motility-associated-like protein
MQLCEGDTASISYLISSTLPGTVDWTYGEANTSGGLSQTFNISEFGTFIVTATLTTPEGCISPTVSTTITIQECPNTLIYIPNTFTPDGNEHNQTWAPVFTSGFDPMEFRLTVFNRWGDIVWESRNHTAEWDGTYNNKKCQDGVYTYKVWFGDPKTDGRYNLYGHFTIIR